MPAVTLRTYSKSEDAVLDAAFLGSMGINACVIDDQSHGAMALGLAECSIRIEVPSEHLEEAQRLLAQQAATDGAVSPPTFDPSWDPAMLHRFLRFLLVFDLVCFALSPIIDRMFAGPTPRQVSDHLMSLVVSNLLWDIAYMSFWPMYVISIVSNVLCLFHSKTGRLLFAITTVWSLLMALGPPPQIYGPLTSFIGGLQTTASNIALALMYWSPVRQKFDQHRWAKA
ncbi:MAG TPA: hypothetical protein VGE39_00600 [Prosthecobacter sp.]